MMRMLFRWSTYRVWVAPFFLWVFILLMPLTPMAQTQTDPFALAENLILSGKYNKALETYQNVYKTSTQSRSKAKALFFMASLYSYYLDQPEKALDTYREIQQNFPREPEAGDALFQSGILMYRLNLTVNARQSFEFYLEKYPEGTHAQSAKDWIDLGLGAVKPPTVKPAVKALSPALRILLAKNESRLVFKSETPVTVKDVQTNRMVFKTEGPLVITLTRGALSINTRSFSLNEYEITTPCGVMAMNGASYRGAIRVHTSRPGLMAVNHITVEDYLYGVVPKEMSWLWNEQALMAQAIVSRTYALYMRDNNRGKNREYDLEASTASQVYGGYDAEKEQARRAVDLTRGQVIMHHGHLAAAYFHSNSGGYTESANNVWGIELPYLKSVPDPFSQHRADMAWELTLSGKEIRDLLKSALPGLGKITAILSGRRSPSGRIRTLTIMTDKGRHTLSGNTFRIALGPTRLKSTLFQIVTGRDGFTFKGTGYGHGVGMSQWGAQCMASAGYTCDKIIRQYYSGVTVGRADYM